MSVNTKITIGIVAFFIALVFLPYLARIRKHSNPTDLQAAKIAQLLNRKWNDSFVIDRFELVYNDGFHDVVGSCGFKIRINPAEADDALTSWTISKNSELMETNVWLIDWLNKTALIQKVPSFYNRTIQCVRASQQSGKWVTWSKKQHCIAFWDPDTSNTLIVSTEGEMFLPDAVFK